MLKKCMINTDIGNRSARRKLISIIPHPAKIETKSEYTIYRITIPCIGFLRFATSKYISPYQTYALHSHVARGGVKNGSTSNRKSIDPTKPDMLGNKSDLGTRDLHVNIVLTEVSSPDSYNTAGSSLNAAIPSFTPFFGEGARLS